MNVTKDQAQDYLETIQQVQQQTRRTLATGGGPIYMILWGLIWVLGYLGSYLLPPQSAGYLWFGLDIVGLAASMGIGWWHATRVRSSTQDARIAIFWLIWLVYTGLIVWLSGSTEDAAQISIVISLMAMFGYVVMGLWLWMPLTWIGAGVTVAIVVAYLVMPQYVDLAMAVLGGGTLVLSGIYIYRNWR